VIKFEYNDGKSAVTTTSDADHLEAVLEDFKAFLLHVGYHYENVENIIYDGRCRQGLRQTFDETYEEIGE